MRFFKETHIDFMGKRKVWYTVSIIALLIGLSGLLFKGFTFGIDFLGGTELIVQFDRPVDVGRIRSALDRSGMSGLEIKSFGSPQDMLIRTPMQVEGTKVADAIKATLTENIPDTPFKVLREDKIGPKIGSELRRDAVYAIGATLIIIMIYVGFRFKFIYGVMGVVALFHDVLLTLGFVAMFNGIGPYLNLEFSMSMMAAFLTLIGFSINDTVIVFDRIRENLKVHKTESLAEVMNKSINQTLSRTIITTGTVVMVLVILFFFGGEVNRGFAFTFLIGSVSGTYSSIYVASALVLDATIRRKSKTQRTTR